MSKLEAGVRVRVTHDTGAVGAGTEAEVVGVYPRHAAVDAAIEVRRGVILRVPTSALQPISAYARAERRVA